MPSKFSDLRLTNIKVPMLLLIGQEEMLYGSIDATVERARRLIPGIQIKIIPKAGHLPNVDQPDVVNAMILKFLAQ
jgi:pimeloyl-ACP methyl ester carboxylesterase